MNTQYAIRNTLRAIGGAALVIIGAAAIALMTGPPTTARADSQGYPTTLGTATNIPTFVTASQASNSLNSWIPISAKKGLALQWQGWMSGATSPACPLYISQSLDGTNVSTNQWTFTVTPAGTNHTTWTTNWSAAQLEGLSWLIVTGVSNAAGGANYLTNGFLMWQYPNN